MKKPTTDVLGSLRVASPCGVGWDSMEGDERVRFCRLCSLNVYNFSDMTRAEVEALVTKTEGRLCGRMTRRADGTVLTKDCPVGLRAVRLRATRAAGAAFAALLSFCSLAFGQTTPQTLSCPGGGQVKVEKKKIESKTSALSGVVVDPFDARVQGAEVLLTDEATKKEFSATTSEEGEFYVPVLPAGTYTLRVNTPGFVEFVVEHFEVEGGEELALKTTLVVGHTMMGIVTTAIEPRPDYEYSNGKATFRGRMLTDLPIPPEK